MYSYFNEILKVLSQLIKNVENTTIGFGNKDNIYFLLQIPYWPSALSFPLLFPPISTVGRVAHLLCVLTVSALENSYRMHSYFYQKDTSSKSGNVKTKHCPFE
jgi:hypothetical protein